MVLNPLSAKRQSGVTVPPVLAAVLGVLLDTELLVEALSFVVWLPVFDVPIDIPSIDCTLEVPITFELIVVVVAPFVDDDIPVPAVEADELAIIFARI